MDIVKSRILTLFIIMFISCDNKSDTTQSFSPTDEIYSRLNLLLVINKITIFDSFKMESILNFRLTN